MKISVSFRNLDPSDHLKNYAETRLSRLKKIMEEPIEAHVVLSVQKFRHLADVSINSNGIKIKAQEETGDLYAAIDMVMDKIENYAYACTFTASKYFGLDVKEPLTLSTRALGILAAGLPLGTLIALYVVFAIRPGEKKNRPT